jgi:hypothetical protein
MFPYDLKTRHGLAAAAGIAVLMLATAGCSNQTVRDLEGVPISDPEKIDLTVNVDEYPNVVAMCIHGAGFAATTRDSSQAALQRVPEWDASKDGWCATP